MITRLFFVLLIATYAITLPAEFARANLTGEAQSGPAATPAQTTQTKAPADAFTGLEKFYGLGLGLVGLSAFFMIVRGGLNYVIAGDNASRVAEGKRMITNALIGVAIAAASYAILYTINPNLVKLRIGEFNEYQNK